jgi:hypothetical protein
MLSQVGKALKDRIAWVEKQADSPLWPGGPTPKQYLQGFVRRPGMGSYVLLDGMPMAIIDEAGRLFDSLVWREVEMPEGTAKPGNTYLVADLPEGRHTAFESVVILSDMTEEELEHVRIKKGPHGLELVAPGQPRQVYSLLAIVDDDGLVTWYPGKPTSFVDLAQATVKLS